MKVYRLCTREEIMAIAQNKNFRKVGKHFEINENIKSHNYHPKRKYLHFFKNKSSLMYLSTIAGRFICVYDLPEQLLNKRKGVGKYRDFVNFTSLHTLEEYAVETSLLEYKHLVATYEIVKTIDYEDVWFSGEAISKFVRKRPLKKFELEPEQER